MDDRKTKVCCFSNKRFHLLSVKPLFDRQSVGWDSFNTPHPFPSLPPSALPPANTEADQPLHQKYQGIFSPSEVHIRSCTIPTRKFLVGVDFRDWCCVVMAQH